MLLVAHGSRDPRHAATVQALCASLRTHRPELRVTAGYLEFNAPSVPQVLERLAASGRAGRGPGRTGVVSTGTGAGTREVIALPLLLSRAFHAKTDIPGVLRAVAGRLPRLSVRQAEVLGPHQLLVTALERRLSEAGLRPTPAEAARTGVVLASAGSTDPGAHAVITEVARQWRRARGWHAVRPAFASATGPGTAEAVRRLRAEGAERVAVAPYVIAPGRLPERIVEGAGEAGADVLAPVLGAAEELVRVLLLRYDEARRADPLSARLSA
ncbi:sirohydrochlorin chelatase [Streptomyces oceani]|uniref:Cobalamin biosynthesis protein CbiX n=1 Tax=Streptomyces oceani TaxID=1075402 RepID=A0A1E7KKI1_9ACTN|nr:sirohydrochlorin chelatase [Streptomyces oceani]OEV04400.1 cobalamin biosynthesis protein CbiX [Streptomyces oceani]